MTDISARTRLAITAGQATGWLSRVTGRGAGATISGRVMNALSSSVLAELARGHRIALISATNGKTTTTRLLTEILRAEGEPVISNSTGANLTSGIAPVLAAAEEPGFAILEVDERVVPKVVDPLAPELLVLGNLSRDQLDRYGEVRAVGNGWRTVAETHPDLHIVANASDPHVVWAASPARTTWVDLGAGWRQDAAACPSCSALLTWTHDRFDCSTCGFTQPEATNRLQDDLLTIGLPRGDARVRLALSLPGRWNLANAALAVTAAVQHFGVHPTDATRAIRDVETVAGRYRTVTLPDGRPLRILLAKNPAGWTEVLRHLAAIDSAVVIAVNARVADGKDPSWLWDVPYELLEGKPVAASGERALDVAVRLHYGDVEHIVEPDPLAAAAALDGEQVHVVASYTQFSALYRRFG